MFKIKTQYYLLIVLTGRKMVPNEVDPVVKGYFDDHERMKVRVKLQRANQDPYWDF